ncbi:MAG TPA: type II toxin-antitoxin system death-on-curing family toxin [Gemmatimonadales bacterium]|nr:type II toxin-antitoxin system death-on-curing family toxin [Gemmatimonadales bacterium]
MKPEFLTVEDVLGIHAEVIAEFGGEGALRDLGLLQSAVAMPQQTFGGQFLHDSLFAMAAAYLFHITQNHAFVDGNKRTALTAALVFLRLNLIVIDRDVEQLYDVTIGVAEGRLDKAAIAAELEAIWMAETKGGAAIDVDDSPGGEEPQVE